LLTAENPDEESDAALFAKLGLRPLELEARSRERNTAQDA
jgi:biotin synthase-like enzyme